MPGRMHYRRGKFFVHCTGALLLIASISGCAGLQSGPAVAPSPPGIRAGRLAKAGRLLHAARRQAAAFYAELGSVDAKIEALRSRPYWSGFERILKQYPGLTDPSRGPQITPQIRSRLSQWSSEAKVPWQAVLRDYLQLADSCAILEMKRVAARQMFISAQAAYMAVVMMDAAAGDQKQAHEIFLLVNSLDKPGAKLASIHLNRLGLYGKQ